MAITSSTIRIYSDEELETLVKTITTQGDNNAIDVSNLDEGEVYWATVQVTESGQTSNESEGYRFFTLPNVFFNDSPSAVGTSIYFETGTTTNTVNIYREGVYCQIADNSERGVQVLSDQDTFRASVDNLKPNTDYTLVPIVIDEFGRTYKNTGATVIVRTTSAVPTVAISGLNPSANTVTGTVTVNSDVSLTGLTVRLLPQGGGTYINATGYTTQTGSQQFTATGLTASTTYTIYATASNVGGNATDTKTVTTLAITASVTLDDCDLVVASPTDSVYVEATGTVGSGADIDTVGVKFFTTNSTSGTPVGDIYGQQGQSSIATTISGLPSGTTLYAFAYMDYTIDNELYTVYSSAQTIVTVPVMTFLTQTVVDDTCSGTFSITGNTLSSVAVQYKAPNDLVWHDATVSGNSYSITGLTRGTTYSLRGTATNSGGTYTTPTSTFTPVAAGTCSFNNDSLFSTSENSYDIIMPFTSTYDITSATVLVDTASDFSTATTYNATVSGTTSGTITCRTNDYGYVAGTTYYFRVIAIDTNGTSFSDDHSNDCPTSTPTITDTGSGFSLSTKRYEVRLTVSNTYALSKLAIKTASNAQMTVMVGTYNYALSATTANVSYNITSRIPASGATMYIQYTATDVYGNSYTTTTSAQVPTQQLTVTTTHTNNGNEFTFTQAVSPSPTVSIASNWVQYRVVGGGPNDWVATTRENGLTPVTQVLMPNSYDIMGCVTNIYGLITSSSTYSNEITLEDPYLVAEYSSPDIKCEIFFNPNITMDTAEIIYDDGNETKRVSINPRDDTYTITSVSAGTYTIYVESVDFDGNIYTSNYVRIVVR